MDLPVDVRLASVVRQEFHLSTDSFERWRFVGFEVDSAIRRTVGMGSVSVGNTCTDGVSAAVGSALIAYPMLGGTNGGSAPAPAPGNGTWGPAAINNLPAGQYLVFGVVTMVAGQQAGVLVYSAGTIVTVP